MKKRLKKQRDQKKKLEYELLVACEKGNYHLVLKLLRKGVNIHTSWEGVKDGPLLVAADMGRFEIVKLLVHRGADVHANGNEALYSARFGHFENMEEFLSGFN